MVTRFIFCCVNRGIISELTNLEKNNEIKTLIDDIITASNVGNNKSPCWPLEFHKNFAVWPMDEESLVTATGSEEKTVCHQIFEFALDEKFWRKDCPAGDHCPFCTNRQLLSNTKNLNSLIKILKNYEYISGAEMEF